MATEEWQEAARNYSLMSTRAKAEYWGQLTPDQQNALRDALASLGPGGATLGQSPAPARRGCSSPLFAGCIGMILGCVLTLGAEVALVMMGVQAVSDTFGGLSGGTASSGGASTSAPQANDANSIDCKDPEYRAAHLYQCDPATWHLENRKAHHPEEFTFPSEPPP